MQKRKNNLIYNSIKNKYLGINLLKEYCETMNEVEKDKIIGKIPHVHGLGEFILLKCEYYQK